MKGMTISRAYDRLRQLNYILCEAEADPAFDPELLRDLKEEEKSLTQMIQDFYDDPITRSISL